MPEGWEVGFDQKYRGIYYYNWSTRERRWNRPAPDDIESACGEYAFGGSAGSTATPVADQLPRHQPPIFEKDLLEQQLPASSLATNSDLDKIQLEFCGGAGHQTAPATELDALMRRVVAAGLADDAAVSIMRSNIACGKFTKEYYQYMWEPQLERLEAMSTRPIPASTNHSLIPAASMLPSEAALPPANTWCLPDTESASHPPVARSMADGKHSRSCMAAIVIHDAIGAAGSTQARSTSPIGGANGESIYCPSAASLIAAASPSCAVAVSALPDTPSFGGGGGFGSHRGSLCVQGPDSILLAPAPTLVGKNSSPQSSVPVPAHSPSRICGDSNGARSDLAVSVPIGSIQIPKFPEAVTAVLVQFLSPGNANADGPSQAAARNCPSGNGGIKHHNSSPSPQEGSEQHAGSPSTLRSSNDMASSLPNLTCGGEQCDFSSVALAEAAGMADAERLVFAREEAVSAAWARRKDCTSAQEVCPLPWNCGGREESGSEAPCKTTGEENRIHAPKDCPPGICTIINDTFTTDTVDPTRKGLESIVALADTPASQVASPQSSDVSWQTAHGSDSTEEQSYVPSPTDVHIACKTPKLESPVVAAEAPVVAEVAPEAPLLQTPPRHGLGIEDASMVEDFESICTDVQVCSEQSFHSPGPVSPQFGQREAGLGDMVKLLSPEKRDELLMAASPDAGEEVWQTPWHELALEGNNAWTGGRIPAIPSAWLGLESSPTTAMPAGNVSTEDSWRADSLYALLGVSDNASAKEITEGYRKIKEQWGPTIDEQFSEEGAFHKSLKTEALQKLTDAFDVLSDQRKRYVYDHKREVLMNPGDWEDAEEFDVLWGRGRKLQEEDHPELGWRELSMDMLHPTLKAKGLDRRTIPDVKPMPGIVDNIMDGLVTALGGKIEERLPRPRFFAA